MNREERRALKKQTGLDLDLLNPDTGALLPGTKVKLNMKQINRSLKKKNPNYQAWVKAHKNDIFTIATCEEFFKHGNGHIYSFVEDDSEEKWLFHTIDLMVVKDGD